LAKSDPIALLGNQVTRWLTFFQAFRKIISNALNNRFGARVLLDQLIKASEPLSALNHIRPAAPEDRSLYGCFNLSQYAIASEPRNTFYGLLGLFVYWAAEPIIPDYSKGLKHVLTEATVVCILDEIVLPYFLLKEDPAEGFGQAPHMPSWIMDFLSLKKSDESFFTKMIRSKLSSVEREGRRSSVRLSVDHQTLYAHGRYVGTIRNILHYPSGAAQSMCCLLDEG
jgi:hypothetical protein